MSNGMTTESVSHARDFMQCRHRAMLRLALRAGAPQMTHDTIGIDTSAVLLKTINSRHAIYITHADAPCMVDWFQVAAIAIECCAAICLGIYYGAFGLPSGKYVSDLLFEKVDYQVVVVVFVSVQLAMCISLVWRLSGGFTRWFGLAAVPLLASIAGWVTLNLVYRDPDGSTSLVHIIGTAVFIVGVGLYFGYLIFCTFAGDSPLHFIMEAFLILLYIATIVFIVVFAYMFLRDEPGGWIYEHAAFITMVIAHAFLFAIASPDPRSTGYKLIGSAKGGADSSAQLLIPRHMR
jgi:hypothetical protein